MTNVALVVESDNKIVGLCNKGLVEAHSKLRVESVCKL